MIKKPLFHNYYLPPKKQCLIYRTFWTKLRTLSKDCARCWLSVKTLLYTLGGWKRVQALCADAGDFGVMEVFCFFWVSYPAQKNFAFDLLALSKKLSNCGFEFRKPRDTCACLSNQTLQVSSATPKTGLPCSNADPR